MYFLASTTDLHVEMFLKLPQIKEIKCQILKALKVVEMNTSLNVNLVLFCSKSWKTYRWKERFNLLIIATLNF